MTSGSTAPVVTRFLVNQPQANHLLQRYALQCMHVSVADGLYKKACDDTNSVHLVLQQVQIDSSSDRVNAVKQSLKQAWDNILKCATAMGLQATKRQCLHVPPSHPSHGDVRPSV